MITNIEQGLRVMTYMGLTGRLTGESWTSSAGLCVKIALDKAHRNITPSGTINISVEFLTELTGLSPEHLAEAEMIQSVYDKAVTNDAACRVAEVARGLCTQHEQADPGFDRDGYMAIIFRTLNAKRAGLNPGGHASLAERVAARKASD